MMERPIIKTFLLMAIISLGSCYYDVAEELYPPTACVTDNMSYSANIIPIIQSNCYTCHSTSAGPANGNVILEGYDEIKKYVDSGQLLGAIKWESGFSRMPQDAPQLSDCNIAKIESWVNDGALNN
jgi:hypothetical protein